MIRCHITRDYWEEGASTGLCGYNLRDKYDYFMPLVSYLKGPRGPLGICPECVAALTPTELLASTDV